MGKEPGRAAPIGPARPGSVLVATDASPMPTYEYKCAACGHTFEKFQSIMAEPIKRCPSCGKAKAKRLISAGAGLIFKGSGFYITDYRDAGYKDSAKADSDAGKSGGEGGGDSKSESKTESKGDSKGEGKSEGKGETKSAASDGAGKSSAAETKAAAPKPEAKSSPKSEGKSSKKKH